MFKLLSFWCVAYLLVGTRQDEKSFDYCKIDCKHTGKGKHTICLYGCNSEKGITPIPADFTFRNNCLHFHNKLRSQIAQGNITVNGLGPAANMMALSYDLELEYTAQCWINYKCVMVRDKCRITQKFKTARQNLYFGTRDMTKPDQLEHGLQTWFDEYKGIEPSQLKSFKKSNKKTGHFTQMIWARTTHVGCALSRYKSSLGNASMYNHFLACNYGPAGNTNCAKVYEPGVGASACPEGKKENKEYKGLCGDIDAWTDEQKETGNPYKAIGKSAQGILDSGSDEATTSAGRLINPCCYYYLTSLWALLKKMM